RDTVQRLFHEAMPDDRRQAAAGQLLGWRAIVIAEPDAGDELRRVTDEPGIPEILAGAGLAGRRPAGDRRLAPGAHLQRLLQHGVHHADMLVADDLPRT